MFWQTYGTLGKILNNFRGIVGFGEVGKAEYTDAEKRFFIDPSEHKSNNRVPIRYYTTNKLPIFWKRGEEPSWVSETNVGNQGTVFNLKESHWQKACDLANYNSQTKSKQTSTAEKEGDPRIVISTKYERSPKKRNACIEEHATICKICEFDFGKFYGVRSDGFIEVHHKIPISVSGPEKEINPIEDLIPVCSNCHRMLHRKQNPVMQPDELKKIISKNRDY